MNNREAISEALVKACKYIQDHEDTANYSKQTAGKALYHELLALVAMLGSGAKSTDPAPAPTTNKEEAERLADNLIAQAQHRDGHNAAEKGLPAARNTLIAALMARPDIHTEAAKWGYIPGSGGLRNPETGERDRS